jgi:hypothetical protein
LIDIVGESVRTDCTVVLGGYVTKGELGATWRYINAAGTITVEVGQFSWTCASEPVKFISASRAGITVVGTIGTLIDNWYCCAASPVASMGSWTGTSKTGDSVGAGSERVTVVGAVCALVDGAELGSRLAKDVKLVAGKC